MRLLNVRTFQLEEYVGTDILRYSILSHRWEDEEVTFHDLVNNRYSEMKGSEKVLGCCRISRNEGLKYTWIDSCCIDKSSSAELSEAINSMFYWYKNAAVCYAYLSDVRTMSDFAASKWFTRGWTLQELIAQDAVVFLNADWCEIGTKTSLIATVSETTGIDRDILGTFRPRPDITECLNELSAARKLSWAAHRVTTKIEDMAYSLLGLFDVNMPLIYGEAKRAFRQLQEEILNNFDDDSLFTWSYNSEECTSSFSGVLADSPCCFRGMKGVDSRTGLAVRISNLVLKNVKLEVSVIGKVRDLYLGDQIHSPPTIRRISDDRHTLISTIRDEYPEDVAVLDATIGALQCRTDLGRIVLLLSEREPNLYIRYHFDGHLYFAQDGMQIQPTRILPVLLYKSQVYDYSSIQIPAVRLHSRVALLGYRAWATSTASNPDPEHRNNYWLRARSGKGYLLFENHRNPRCPPFMLMYRHEPADNQFEIYCGLVADDYMPEDAVRSFGEVEFRSSRNVSELRVPLTPRKQLVAKVRMRFNCCDIILLAQ
ncbi:heterokaryon incompatibility protein-domain-containing protein [Xylaria sp. FL0043]|nr:heterokaryon incompatibility protein-domain-containing protein [Xylaria sp. FL0043]